MSDADLVFLPWVRRGAAAALLDPDTFGANQPGVASATASDHDQRRAPPRRCRSR